MELTDHDRRIMPRTRDRMLLEAMSEAELAVTHEEAAIASYLAVVEKLRIMETRYEECRRALWGAVALAGALFLIAVAAVVRGL